MESLDVLAFAPHPDDAEASCGGLLLSLSRRGYRVGICDLTRGELGTNGSIQERAKEADAAAEILEIHERVNLSLPDGGLHAQDREQLQAVVEVIRRLRPRLLIAPYEASRHPDHQMATQLIRRARFFCGLMKYSTPTAEVVRPQLLYGLDYHPMPPNFVVDITEVFAEKMRALRCYVSQFERNPENLSTLLNNPAYLRRIEVNARTYGQFIQSDAGEPYRVEGMLHLEDPVAALSTSIPGGQV